MVSLCSSPDFFRPMKSISFLVHSIGTLVGLLALEPFSQVVAEIFTLDPEQSLVTISGSVVGGTITNQGPGSLTTKFGGTIQVSITGNSLQFTGQSHVVGQTNGSWQPKSDGSSGNEPADYGGYANVGIAAGYAALRDLLFDVVSPPLTMNGGQFDSSSLTFFFP